MGRARPVINVPTGAHVSIPYQAPWSPFIQVLLGVWMFYSALVAFPIGVKKVRVAKQFEEINENGTLLYKCAFTSI